MSINVSLATLSTLNNTSILTQSNTNFSIIQSALTNCLSTNGQSPNQMQSTLDMNQNQIINLPSPASINSPARLADVVTNPTITVPPTGTSGGVVPFLNGNNTWSGTNLFNGTITIGGSSSITLNGSISGSSGLSTNSTGSLFIFNPGGTLTLSCNSGFGSTLQMNGGTSGAAFIGVTSTGQMQINGNGQIIQYNDSHSFSATGSVSINPIGSTGPTGSHANVQTWLTIIDNSGATRYIPCY